MTLACPAPDIGAGIALRLSTYLDCQGHALGENGWAAVAGGVVAGGLLEGLITIFVALVGYRLILGHVPTLRDGVGLIVRLGAVLALATSWPAFDTLLYRVMADGPDQLGQVLLPAIGLSAGDGGGRVQAAYDALRLGSEPQAFQRPADAAAAAVSSPGAGTPATPPTAPQLLPRTVQPPLPQTASLLVVMTSGLGGALRVTIGVLLALGPVAILGLLFDATLGLVAGWLRALTGAAFALVAASVVAALELTVLDGELARIAALGDDRATFDPQALTTLVLSFALVTLIATLAAARVGNALRFTPMLTRLASSSERAASPIRAAASQAVVLPTRAVTLADRPARAVAIADALAGSVQRGGDARANAGGAGPPSRATVLAGRERPVGAIPLGVAARRAQPRPSRTATMRDRRQ